MTTKQMMDIFYKGSQSSFGPLNLSSLEKYMLTHTFFDVFKETKEPTMPTIIEPMKPVFVDPIIPILKPPPTELIRPPTEPIKPPVEPMKSPIRTRFRSYLKDSLFWCMYVHSHGITAFETTKAIGTNMLNLMMNEKRAISDFFNKDENKTALKNINHKITNVKINEIKCDLMTKPMLTSIEALIPCCVYWNCPIYVDLGNKTFLHFVPNTYVSDDDESANEGPEDPKVPKVTFIDAVLLYMCEGRFELELDQEKKSQRIREMCQGFYKIPHYEKPLLGIGTYKTDELQYLYDMVITAKDVVCCTKTKMKKQELYEAIAQKCVLPTTMF